MQAAPHREQIPSSCFYPQEMWNINKPSIFLPKTCGNCLHRWREMLKETWPATGLEPYLEQSAADPLCESWGALLAGKNSCKSSFNTDLSSCTSEYTAVTYCNSHMHQSYTSISTVTSVESLQPCIR